MSINQRLFKHLGIILVILSLCLILMWGIRVISAVIDLKTNLDYARELIAVDNPLTIDPEEITVIINSSRKDVLTLQRDTAFLLKFTPLVSRLPGVGKSLDALPDLLIFADVGTRTATDLWMHTRPTYLKVQQDGISIEVITELLSTLTSEAMSLQENAQQLLVAYNAVDSDVLPWRYQKLFNQLGFPLSLFYNSLSLLDDIPQLIGVDDPSTYLVLALNEDELRAGGGFIITGLLYR